jgi:hypothetical protein
MMFSFQGAEFLVEIPALKRTTFIYATKPFRFENLKSQISGLSI